MSKSRLLVGAMVAVCALAATSDVVSAAAKHHAAAKAAPAKPVTFDSGPSNYCGKGNAPILHSMNPAHLYWGCVTATGAPIHPAHRTAHRKPA
jgi:hypothetical protein